MAKAKQRVKVDGSATELRQSLPGLGALRDKLPAAAAPAPEGAAGAPAASAPAPASTVYSRPTRIVVRRERKGHGGKTATRIEGLAGSMREMEAARREIQRALGCGAALDGGEIVVQGAQGERLVAFLSAHGARKIVVGS